MNIYQHLDTCIKEHGYQYRITPIHHIPEIMGEIQERRAHKEFDARFFEQRLAQLEFNPPSTPQPHRSILLIAIPRPQVRVSFDWRGQTIPVIIPPTYSGYHQTDIATKSWLDEILNPFGSTFAHFTLPLKLLAVRSGLADYGRNNITYVASMGSFFQLVAYYTTLPALEDNWREPQMMAACQRCKACLKHCPTGAITGERFLLHAERCLTYMNESQEDMPGWVDPAWLNSWVGCMRCQFYCPENLEMRTFFGPEIRFSEDETQQILKGIPPEQLSPGAAEKWIRLEFGESYQIMVRNLHLILQS